MAQYPVSNEQGLIEGINYLLSGPAGLGQNFEGSYRDGLLTPQAVNMTQAETYCTGNFGNLQEFSGLQVTPEIVDRYLDYLTPTDRYYPALSTIPGDIQVVSITVINSSIIEVTYTVSTLVNMTLAPFVNGQLVTISGSTPSIYNRSYTVVDYAEPGEFAPPSNAVRLQSATPQSWTAYTSGAVMELNSGFTGTVTQNIPTSAQAFVTVNGTDQRVFLSAQCYFDFFTYVKFVATLAFQPVAYLRINRYTAVAQTTLPDNLGGSDTWSSQADRIYGGYIWRLDATPVSRPFLLDWDSFGSEVKINQLGLQIFNNVIDRPEPGFYWYALEIGIDADRDASPDDGAILPIGLRTQGTLSFAAQVVKE